MRFKVYGRTLQSNIAFPELPRSSVMDATLGFRLDRRPRAPDVPDQWIRHWMLPGGRPWLLVGASDDTLVLRFPRLADFVIASGGRETTCYARALTPRATIRHLWLDQVLPLSLSMQGRIVLHASAVSTPRGAVAFLAGPRAGKSTLATGLGRLGWRLIADDALLVDDRGGRRLAVPSYPTVRLWPDVASEVRRSREGAPSVAHYTEKQRLTPHAAGMRYRQRAQRLARLYVLTGLRAARGAARVSPISVRDAVVELVKFTFCLEIGNRERLADQFERLSHDARAVTMRRLALPLNGARPHRAREAITEDLAADG